jgi:DNA polymerase (family 10)
MDNREVFIGMLEEMAILLELAGENPFKIRAYENAGRLLANTPQALEDLIESPPKGIGAGLQEKLREFQQTGLIAELSELKSRFPATLFDLLKIQGVGPKKVKTLFEDLHIATLTDLETACRENRLESVKGFGKKTQENILRGIQRVKRFKGLFLFSEAEQVAEAVCAYLRQAFPDQLFQIAGSLRRCKEVVKDVDILAASAAPAALMKHFVAYPQQARILQEGETKSAIQLESGLQIDLRVVPPDCFGPALCHFTGSKEHNTRMRSLANAQGKKLNEYGLFENGRALPLKTETDVFAALGLPYIAPELREDLGEIEWAQQQSLPPLVERSDLIGAVHCHSTFSDGMGTLEQMAAAAQTAGLRWFGIADHSRSAFYARGMEPERVLEQWKAIDELNASLKGFRLLKGIESDILPDGGLDYQTHLLEGFDFVIASIHSSFSMTAAEMTDRILKAVANPFTDILGHPTGRLLLAREEYSIDLDRILQACLEHQVIVEINANPIRLDLDWRKVRQWRDSGLKFVICPDAHSPNGIADIRYGLGVARKGGLRADNLLNSVDVDEFRGAIRRRRSAR